MLGKCTRGVLFGKAIGTLLVNGAAEIERTGILNELATEFVESETIDALLAKLGETILVE